jgi:hypothetical protein
VTDPAAHVEHVADGVESPALRHELQEVEVPPVVARVTEVFGGVRGLALELVAHGDPWTSADRLPIAFSRVVTGT